MRNGKARDVIGVLAACAFAVLAPWNATCGAVTVSYDGRLLDAGGAVLANVTKNADFTAYSDKDGANRLATAATEISTDADGCFSVSADLSVPDGTTTFWAGVEVDGVAIRPLMRVNPAPFALAASEAVRIESEGAMAVAGGVTAAALADNAAVTTKDVTFGGRTTVRGDVHNAGCTTVKTLDVANGCVGLMRTDYPFDIKTGWDDFWGENSLSMDASGSSGSIYEVLEVIAQGDGFAMVMIRGECRGPSTNYVDFYVDNGEMPICSKFSLDTARPHFAMGGGDKWLVCHLLTFPVRRGMVIGVIANCCKPTSDNSTLKAEAKVRMVYFGAK